MIKQNIIEKILDYALTHGGDFAEVYYEDVMKNQLAILGDRITNITSGRECGVGIRVFFREESVYLYSSNIEEKMLLNLLKEGLRKSHDQLCIPEKIMLDHLIKYDTVGNQARLQEKIKLLKSCNHAGKLESSYINQMSSSYTDIDQKVRIANTEGCYVDDRRMKTRLLIRGFAKDGNDKASSYIGPGAMSGFEFYDKINPEEYAREVARAAVSSLNARPCPTGRMPVIIANGFGGLFFHEACGHSLEASSMADGASEFSGKLGQKIASEKVTLIDDGGMNGQWGSLHVDDEGEKTRKNILIEHGILKSCLVDKWNGRKMDIAPTGSARRQSYRFSPTSRMTNTYIALGTDHLDEMINSVEKGLFVKNINAGSVNPQTGEFNFNTIDTFLIEHGEITGPVRNATLIGTGGNILQKVESVAKDYRMGQGFCYADSGAIYIGAGQPSIKISELTVGGDEIC